MISHKRLAQGLPVAELQRRLRERPELFGQIPYRGRGDSPHREMTDIWVRYQDVKPFEEKGDFSAFNAEHDSTWYPSYYELPELRSLVFATMGLVEGERLGAVLLTKLAPGGRIYPHIDSGWHALYYDKYYIPIQNGEGAIFGFEDGIIAPDEGDVWWFNNQVPHWVVNNSRDDRIALIVCVRSEVSKERLNAA